MVVTPALEISQEAMAMVNAKMAKSVAGWGSLLPTCSTLSRNLSRMDLFAAAAFSLPSVIVNPLCLSDGPFSIQLV
jgi:hypothetical protein